MTGRGRNGSPKHFTVLSVNVSEVTNILFRSSTEHQDLMIFETPCFSDAFCA